MLQQYDWFLIFIIFTRFPSFYFDYFYFKVNITFLCVFYSFFYANCLSEAVASWHNAAASYDYID